MRIVIALGGNALLQRGEPPEAALQQSHVRAAVQSLAPLATAHELVITHGNGPQVGLLAMQSARDEALKQPYPFDALGAETQGLIGYWLVQALRNSLPQRQVACVITETLVGADDPALDRPTKFVGPLYTERDAARLAAERGWQVAADGRGWRRVVPSPLPRGILETPIIRLLLDAGVIVVCAGGGGTPVIRTNTGELVGVDAVVDKDFAAALLGETLDADALLLLTDVPAVEDNYGRRGARQIRRAAPGDLDGRPFPAGSMGPKVEAACQFVERTGHMAAIGALADTSAILAGRRGTIITSTGAYP